MTAFYSFRQVFIVFLGDERYHELGIHPHEAKPYALWAMSVLAVLAVIAGWFREDFMEFITKFLPSYEMSEHTHHMVWILTIVTTAIAVSGILLAYFKYHRKLNRDHIKEQGFVYKLLYNQYYIPHFYEKALTVPYAKLSDIAWQEVDMKVVDATVDGIAKTIESGGDVSRRAQSGNLSSYLKWMTGGLILITIIAVVSVVMK